MKGIINYDDYYYYYENRGTNMSLGKSKEEALHALIQYDLISDNEPFIVKDKEEEIIYNSLNKTTDDIINYIIENINRLVPRTCIYYNESYPSFYTSFDMICHLYEYWVWDKIVNKIKIHNLIEQLINDALVKGNNGEVIRLYTETSYKVKDGIVKEFPYEGMTIEQVVKTGIEDEFEYRMNNRARYLEKQIINFQAFKNIQEKWPWVKKSILDKIKLPLSEEDYDYLSKHHWDHDYREELEDAYFEKFEWKALTSPMNVAYSDLV